MTKPMAWAALAGALVGFELFGAECWAVYRELSSVVFDAGYEPLPDVEISTGYTSDSAATNSLLNERLGHRLGGPGRPCRGGPTR